MKDKKEWSLKDVEDHIKVNVTDYGAAVVVGALFKKLYGVYPKIGLSGFQAGAIDALLLVLPDGTK